MAYYSADSSRPLPPEPPLRRSVILHCAVLYYTTLHYIILIYYIVHTRYYIYYMLHAICYLLYTVYYILHTIYHILDATLRAAAVLCLLSLFFDAIPLLAGLQGRSEARDVV